MSSATPELLARCVVRTLEEAAFVFAEPAEISPPPFSGTVIEARLEFRGKETGELRISTDEALAAELAANLLGEDPSDPSVATRGREALGELANMVAGALMVDLYGDEACCGLSVPAIRALPGTARGQAETGAACSVVLVTEEGHRLDAILRTTSGG